MVCTVIVPPLLVFKSDQPSAIKFEGFVEPVGINPPEQQPEPLPPLKVINPFVLTYILVYGVHIKLKVNPIGKIPETTSSPETTAVKLLGTGVKVRGTID
jgi:hypothetical protein